MSTKKLRECLQYMRELHGLGTMEDALAELEAIEKACRDLDDNLPAQIFGMEPRKVEAAMDLLERIADESRKG